MISKFSQGIRFVKTIHRRVAENAKEAQREEQPLCASSASLR